MITTAEPRGEFNIVHIRECESEGGRPHRRTISPSDDYSSESAEVKAVCDEAFTDEIKTAYSNR